MNKTPTTLIIMDGFGIAPPADDNAVTLAKTPGWIRTPRNTGQKSICWRSR